ncbi:MAG TPA: M48 family metallopeptidase [Acidisarcina sp.]|nr:M48 family metallopeptidase [Acidisarcina sp.]
MSRRRNGNRIPLRMAVVAGLAMAPLACWSAGTGYAAASEDSPQSTSTSTTANPQDNSAPASSPANAPQSAPNPQTAPNNPPDNANGTATTPGGTGTAPTATTSPQQNSGSGTPATPASGSSSADKTAPKVKSGSIKDVNSVGNRDIGGRGMGNWYSTESEIKMGKGYAMELEKSTRLITDPVVTEYINRVGQNLVKNSDAKVPFTIKVIDSDEINAMALPGGFFYVNSGLILAADEEAELAGVMAHEIAHVAAHHAAREQTRSNYAQLGSIPLIFVGGWLGYGLYEAASIGVPLTFLKFSREFETQADYLGVEYMYRAGYDPQAFISFFEKIQNLEKQKPGAVSKAFSSHPQTPDRIAHSQDEIAKILPARDEYVVTTSEFDDVKARLARIENKRKLQDGKDGKKPTLRRASSNPNGTGSDPSQQGDDRPTLQRRDNN